MIHQVVTSFPTSRRLITVLLVLVMSLAACSSDDAETSTSSAGETVTTAAAVTASTARSQPDGASSFFAINEIGLGADGYISLTNFTEVPVTLDGLFLCQRPNYVALPDVTVEPGQTVRVAVGDGDSIENVVVTNADLGDLKPEDGEIALYTSQDFDDPAAMIVYLEWGSTPHGRSSVAVDAGLWLEGSFAPTSATATRLFRVEDSGLWLFEPNN